MIFAAYFLLYSVTRLDVFNWVFIADSLCKSLEM